MIIFIFIFVFIISFGLFLYYYNSTTFNIYAVGLLSFIVAIISLFVVIVMGVDCLINHINASADKAGFEKRYESLVYQLENDLYDNDNDIGKKELYDEITNWNYDLARRKELSKNFWVGILWADIYDDLEFIEFGGESQ